MVARFKNKLANVPKKTVNMSPEYIIIFLTMQLLYDLARLE